MKGGGAVLLTPIGRSSPMIGKLTIIAGIGLHISRAEQLTMLEPVLLGGPAPIFPNAPVRQTRLGMAGIPES